MEVFDCQSGSLQEREGRSGEGVRESLQVEHLQLGEGNTHTLIQSGVAVCVSGAKTVFVCSLCLSDCLLFCQSVSTLISAQKLIDYLLQHVLQH